MLRRAIECLLGCARMTNRVCVRMRVRMRVRGYILVDTVCCIVHKSG